MNCIKSMTIKGFWGSRDLTLDFQNDINFIIGVNGSGKTTLINILAAALNADFQNLDRLPFSKIKINLSEIHGNKRPIIEIEKTYKKNTPFSGILYSIRDKSSDEPKKYSLDDLEEKLAYRSYPPRYLRELLQRSTTGLMEHLRRLVNVSWVSIHRSQTVVPVREDRDYESSVDKKLDELSIEFIRYFSILSKSGTLETDSFQKKIFLSLVPEESDQQLFIAAKDLNLDDERKALIDIFTQFEADVKSLEPKVVKYFNILKEAIQRLTSGTGVTPEELIALLSIWRIHSVVQEWNKLKKRQVEINEPKETFLKIINSMFQRKELRINEKNELIAVTQSEKRLSLTQLSSGEKQLLIILGEALLQNNSPWIYVADEPELSLHIAWQDKIITNLRKINPNSQIIFATHSPDIVSTYQSKVINMEELL